MALKKAKDVGLAKRTGLYFKGEEIVLGRRRGRPPKYTRNLENGWWSQEKKIECCTLYAAVGNVRDVSQLTDVPENVLRAWKTEDWWCEVIAQVTREEDEAITAKFTHVVNTALDGLIEVLEKGNRVYNPKTDTYVDVPLTSKDLTQIASVFTDKRQLIQGKPTSRVERSSPDDRLQKLAKEFEKFSKAKTITNEEIEDGSSQEGIQGRTVQRQGQEEELLNDQPIVEEESQ